MAGSIREMTFFRALFQPRTVAETACRRQEARPVPNGNNAIAACCALKCRRRPDFFTFASCAAQAAVA
jgi:hypothetical protein